MDTLVLNSAYLPIDRISWTEAIADLITGRAEVVDTYDDRVVKSGMNARSSWSRQFEALRTEEAGVWKVPSVIRFLGKAIFNRLYVKFNRHNLWLRDRGMCQYCGKKLSLKEYTYDHVMPVSRGGKTEWTNIVCACLDCNGRKADNTPEEARMKLIQKPFRPQTVPGQVSPALRWNDGMPTSWKQFLASVSYWHSTLDTE